MNDLNHTKEYRRSTDSKSVMDVQSQGKCPGTDHIYGPGGCNSHFTSLKNVLITGVSKLRGLYARVEKPARVSLIHLQLPGKTETSGTKGPGTVGKFSIMGGQIEGLIVVMKDLLRYWYFRLGFVCFQKLRTSF